MTLEYVGASQFDWYIQPTERLNYETEFEKASHYGTHAPSMPPATLAPVVSIALYLVWH